MEDSDNDDMLLESESENTSEIIPDPQFTDKLYKEASKDENILVSPISAEIVLAMTYQGASGETAEKVATTLDVVNQKAAEDKYKCVIERLNGITNATFYNANKIFIMKDFPLKNTIENVIEKSFMSKIDSIDFADNKKAADDINQWVEDKTKTTIKDLISPDTLDDSVRLVLLNALYLKSNWEKPFLEEDITMQPFYISGDEAVECEMMFVTDYFNYCSYHEKLDAKVLELPFKGKEVSMNIILPSDYEDIAKLENKLVNVNISKLMQGQKNVNVERMEVFLPKFKIEATIDVTPLLKKMGLETIFDSTSADFSKFSESSESLYVSQFLQKTLIEVDEKEIGAATATEDMECSMTSPGQFTADRPFMFILQANGENDNIVLFVGKVLNPTC